MMKRYKFHKRIGCLNSRSGCDLEEHSQGDWCRWEDVPGWIPADSNRQPIRQLVMIEGTKFHSGEHWPRRYTGEAYTRKSGPLGLREKDFYRLCEDGDIDPGTAKIIYWVPYRDILPQPPEDSDDGK